MWWNYIRTAQKRNDNIIILGFPNFQTFWDFPIFKHQSFERNMAPTWQDYVDNVLISSGYASQAAIFSTDKLQQLATSKNFNLHTEEIKTILKGFLEPEILIRKGVILGEQKFTYTSCDALMVTGKCYKSGCVIARCRRCVIVTVYEDTMNCSSLMALVHKLADHFKEHGY